MARAGRQGYNRVPMVRLTTEPAEHLHLLSLLIRDRLQESLGTPAGQKRADKLKGTVGLAAGGMESRMRFERGRVHLDQGPLREATVRGSGTLAAFLAVCQGKMKATQLLRGRLRVSGNPLLLARALPLLQAEAGDDDLEDAQP